MTFQYKAGAVSAAVTFPVHVQVLPLLPRNAQLLHGATAVSSGAHDRLCPEVSTLRTRRHRGLCHAGEAVAAQLQACQRGQRRQARHLAPLRQRIVLQVQCLQGL